MTSESQLYVWVWLPGAFAPIVAGAIRKEGDQYHFAYGQSYLKRENTISLFTPELPLKKGNQIPHWELASCLRDALPDAWGRRVIINRLTGKKGTAAGSVDFDELTFMLESGSDRSGNLDFQKSSQLYEARDQKDVSLDELSMAVEQVEKGNTLSPELERALLHGTSIGGARPKVFIGDDQKRYIAKFTTSSDLFNMVKSEYIAMELAKLSGLKVANVSLQQALGKDILLVERFDRYRIEDKWCRRGLVSALTILELQEMQARYASYQDLAEHIRRTFREPKKTLNELFRRMVFNILVGNTDDHARNHAAFWDGEYLTLTPAYDICPQARTGQIASQAMLINEHNNLSQICQCLEAAPSFLLNSKQAENSVVELIESVVQHWSPVCEKAEISQVDKALLEGNQFLNPFAFQNLSDSVSSIKNPWEYKNPSLL